MPCLAFGCTCLFSCLFITVGNCYDILGTVAASIADIDFVQRRKCIEQVFEDGTVSFLSISSLRYGFKIIDTLTISAIARYLSVTGALKSSFNVSENCDSLVDILHLLLLM
jgi:hypothetical protein